jgi:hypothetical protein
MDIDYLEFGFLVGHASACPASGARPELAKLNEA